MITPGPLLATPRCDFASAEAAAAAYAAARSRVTRSLFAVVPLVTVVCLPAPHLFLPIGNDPELRRLTRIEAPLFFAVALMCVVVALTQLALVVHVRTMRQPPPGAGVAAWYAATRDNVIREGRSLLCAAALGAAMVAGGGAAAVAAVEALARTRLTWDLPVAMTLPAAGVVAVVGVAGLGHLHRPDAALAPRDRPAITWPARAWWALALGIVGIFAGSVAAPLGDRIPGIRTGTIVDSEGSGPGFEFPVVVARVPALPFLAGAVAALGWLFLAYAARTAGRRRAVLLTGAVLTTWLGAAVEPATGHGLAWLWYGGVPGLLVAAGLVAGARRDGPGRPAREPAAPVTGPRPVAMPFRTL